MNNRRNIRVLAAGLITLSFTAIPIAAGAQPLRPNGTVDASIPEDTNPDILSDTDVTDNRASKRNMQEAPDTIIENIEFVGDGVPKSVANTAQSYVGSYASADNLRALAADMTDAFEKSSVPLYTFTIPEQDMTDGTIRVLVGEGHVGAVVLKGETETGASPLVRKIMGKIVMFSRSNGANMNAHCCSSTRSRDSAPKARWPG